MYLYMYLFDITFKFVIAKSHLKNMYLFDIFLIFSIKKSHIICLENIEVLSYVFFKQTKLYNM